MAFLTRLAGIATSGFSDCCALRMRVSMSAMGSLMLMRAPLPTRLDHAGNLAVKRDDAQLATRQTELAVDAARPTRQRATVPQPDRRGVARQLLQLLARGVTLLDGELLVVRDLQ